jgi:hypothetical protein
MRYASRMCAVPDGAATELASALCAPGHSERLRFPSRHRITTMTYGTDQTFEKIETKLTGQFLIRVGR